MRKHKFHEYLVKKIENSEVVKGPSNNKWHTKVHVTRDIFAHNISIKRQTDTAIFET